MRRIAETRAEPINVPVPNPDEVRRRLAENLQENRLLRSLLRLSEKTAEVRRAFGHAPCAADQRRDGRAL